MLTAYVFDIGKYDIDDIHTAVAEADDLEQAELIKGCDVIKMEWSGAIRRCWELHNTIESALCRIIADSLVTYIINHYLLTPI